MAKINNIESFIDHVDNILLILYYLDYDYYDIQYKSKSSCYLIAGQSKLLIYPEDDYDQYSNPMEIHRLLKESCDHKYTEAKMNRKDVRYAINYIKSILTNYVKYYAR
jgi:hypothetical protein